MIRQQTVANYFKTWLELRKSTLAPSTYSGYKTTLRKWILPSIGHMPLEDLNPLHIMQAISPLLDQGYTRQAQLVRVLLRCALQDALHMGLIDRNPADAVRSPVHRKKSIEYWPIEIIHRFLHAQRFSPLYHIWLLALLCGLRRGELLGLRWSDVDLAAAQITIRNQRMLIERKLIDKPPKSAAGNRVLPLPAAAVDALRRARRSSTFLYVCGDLSPQQLRSALDHACTDSGVPRIHIHGLRHSMATAALASGIDIKILQSILGHSHYSVTADTYLHPSDAIRAEAVANLAEHVL